MTIPPGAVPDSTAIVFTYQKNGKALSFTADKFPADFDDSYKYVKREDKVMRKGNATPAIRDFALQTVSGNDTTSALLAEPGDHVFLFVKDGFEKGDWVARAAAINNKAWEKGMMTFLVTNLMPDELVKSVPELVMFTPLRSDGTAIKTAARHNPTLFVINKGTVIKKWSAADFEEAEEYFQ